MDTAEGEEDFVKQTREREREREGRMVEMDRNVAWQFPFFFKYWMDGSASLVFADLVCFPSARLPFVFWSLENWLAGFRGRGKLACGGGGGGILR
jgi:hypothetical protein